MFGAIKSGVAKGKIKGKLNKLLGEQKDRGRFSQDSMEASSLLVEAIYQQSPDVFEGRFGTRPDTDIAIAFALANGLSSQFEWGDDRMGMTMAFGEALAPLSRDSKKLTKLDLELIEHMRPFLTELEKEVNASPLSRQVQEFLRQ